METNERTGRPTRVTTGTRRRVVVDNSELARQIGARIRQARTAAGLTQAKLAGDRYTKAYVSALETGQAKPSMAALAYLSERLGVTPNRFLDDDAPAWRRLEADIALASGRFTDAIDAYLALLDSDPPAGTRAGILGGLAEAYAGVGRGADAIAAAAEAARLFDAGGQRAEAAIARYWLAGGQYQVGNSTEAEGIHLANLAEVRAGLKVEPDFEVRILMALSSAASRDGRHAVALGYLEEVRSVAAGLDDRRRGAYLYDLAYTYRETGDVEAAIRTGVVSLSLFRAADYELGIGALENDLALSYLATGNSDRASDLATSAAAHFEHLRDDRWLAHVQETRAQIALAKGLPDEAGELARSSLDLADRTGNEKAAVSALRTLGRIERSRGDKDRALELAQAAAERARASGSPGSIRDAMREWAELLAETGRHAEAFAVLSEAMQAG